MLGVRSSAPASSADKRMQRAAVNITLKEQGEAWPQNKLSKKTALCFKSRYSSILSSPLLTQFVRWCYLERYNIVHKSGFRSTGIWVRGLVGWKITCGQFKNTRWLYTTYVVGLPSYGGFLACPHKYFGIIVHGTVGTSLVWRRAQINSETVDFPALCRRAESGEPRRLNESAPCGPRKVRQRVSDLAVDNRRHSPQAVIAHTVPCRTARRFNSGKRDRLSNTV